jgi:PilZ domain-containing protein
MPLDGRTEKRAPMAMAMNLANAEDQLVTEKVLTENVSPHGARVVTKRRWQPGEQARLVRLTGESGLPARVVYCQRLRDGLFCLGLEFRARSVKWG